MWERLQKAVEIFWENGEQFWSNRFDFLLSLNEKTISKNLEVLLEKRMFELLRNKSQINILYDIQCLQFVEFCKLKHQKNESLDNIKTYLMDLPSQSSIEKLIDRK